MARRLRPRVVLLSAPGTLDGIGRSLRPAGVRLARIVTMVPRPVAPGHWLRRWPASFAPDTVLVTSRAAVAAGIVPWLRRKRPPPRSVDFWAAGPGTAQALRTAGVRRIRRPRPVGAAGVRAALSQGPPRNVLYFRSDRAGPTLAQALRSQGHRVLDLVVYRLEPVPTFSAGAVAQIDAADLLIATSPSALAALRRGLGRSAFARIRSANRVVVLGARSQRAARGHGFRHVLVAPATTTQRFTRYLLRELRNAPT